MKKSYIQAIRIILLVLIIIGLALLATYKLWVPTVVQAILTHEQTSTDSSVAPTSAATTHSAATNAAPAQIPPTPPSTLIPPKGTVVSVTSTTTVTK